jgi:hypothetical protein
MTIINDYTFRIVAEQRQHDLWAEAASHRLAASVRGDRSMWWRRLLPTRVAPAAKRPASAGASVPSQPVPC